MLIFVFLIAAFAAPRDVSAVNARATPIPTIISNASSPLVVVGDKGSVEGIFDPSAVIAGNALVMSYSSVPTQEAIRTRLAVFDDGRSEWRFLTDINSPYNATIPGSSCPGGLCPGTVVHEVSSLIIDPSDPDVTRRVKVLCGLRHTPV